MPTSEFILSGLKETANDWRLLAILWHVYFGAIIFSLALGMRPSKRLAGILLTLPLLSVSALAWASANPFNGTLFAVSGISILLVSSKLSREKVQIAPLWAVGAGGLMFVFGWLYPHFLETSSVLSYLYAAPTGLIPCPTLSIVIGLDMTLNGLDSRAISMVLGGTGVFYGIWGITRLGVTLDWFLLFGALMILLAAFFGAQSAKED